MAIKKYINTTEAAELTGRPYNEIRISLKLVCCLVIKRTEDISG